MSLDNMKELALEVGLLNTQIKTLQERKKMLEQELRPVLLDRGTVVFGDYQFTCKMVAGRKSLSKQLLIDGGINVEEYMTTGAPFTTMTIKKVEVV